MTSVSNPTHSAMFSLLIFLCISSFKLSYCTGNHTIFCPEIEKQSLLSFKQSLYDPYHQLSSWDGGVSCCKWKGVICNSFTGHVHQLHLRRNPLFSYGLEGKINPSLLHLRYLRYLDLSGNSFNGETIPSFIGSFKSLEYLNLSNSGFQGKVPHSIGNLSNLHTLDLADSTFRLLIVDSLEWLPGLSKLEHLNMDGANFSRATNWAQVITSLPSLLELSLQYCILDFMAPTDDVNVSSPLKYLELSSNRIDVSSSMVPRWFFQLSNLVSLDLRFNNFIGPIPSISNATKLQHLDLYANSFNSSIPDWLYLCKDLKFLDLTYSSLNGAISGSIGNLTSLNILHLSSNKLSGKIPKEIANLCKLQRLDLSKNNFQGDILDSIGNMSKCFLGASEFKSLRYLDLSSNSLDGAVPINIGKLSYLEQLRLNGNKFTGSLPQSYGQLLNLELLDISNNKLEGVVSESHFANLTKLESLSASGNLMTLKVSPNWDPPFQLRYLRIASWNLGAGSQIPPWLETQKNITELDLSNTGVSGNIPKWLWTIQLLDLSHNHLHGKIPHIDGLGLQNIYLGSNKFSGSLPRVANTVIELDLSNNSFSGSMSHFLCDKSFETSYMNILHLGGNQLSGEVPDCWMKWPSLMYLNLGNNNFPGSIPHSIGFLANLKSLNLYGNKLGGEIPFSLHKCTELQMVDLADNDLDGEIPKWVGTKLIQLKFLILRSNKLSGKIPSEICHLKSLQILDLSDNKLSSVIPKCVYNFTAMATPATFIRLYLYGNSVIERATVATKARELQYDTILSFVYIMDLSKNNLSGEIPKELASLVELRSLNLSRNRLTGPIPENIGDMKQLESLDFSTNYLSGQVPNSFTLLSFLSYLNLSYNNLSGEIPKSTQLQRLDASSFVGNDLCGPPLTSSCSHDGDGVREDKDNDEDGGGDSEIKWVYVFVSLGYAVGFSAVCSTLLLNKPWREAYFELLENMWDKCYVYVYIKWTRFT